MLKISRLQGETRFSIIASLERAIVNSYARAPAPKGRGMDLQILGKDKLSCMWDDEHAASLSKLRVGGLRSLANGRIGERARWGIHGTGLNSLEMASDHLY